MDIRKVPPKATNFVNMTKSDKYQELYKTIESVISGENDQIANMANTAALLHEAFGFWWTGFYMALDFI